MKLSPLLTIAIPTYNRAAYLDRELKSLADQYNKDYDIEIVISDNASTDNTAEIAQKYTNSGLPIKYLRNEKNIGPDLNIAQCYYLAKSKFVVVFGDDDIFLDNYLKYTFKILSEHGDCGLVYFNYYGFFENYLVEAPRIHLFKNTYQYKKEAIIRIIRSRIGFTSASIVNTKFIKKDKLIGDAGTNFNHVPLLLEAIIASEKNFYISDFLIAQQNANSGGFSYFKVFGENLYTVVSGTLKENTKAIGWIAKHLILNFFTGAIIDLRKDAKNTDNTANALKYLKPHYQKYLLFWICNYPVAKLPYLLAKLYSYPVRLYAKVSSIYYKIPLGKKLH